MLSRARFPQFSVQCPFGQNLQCLQEKHIVPVVYRENISSQGVILVESFIFFLGGVLLIG